MIDVELLPARYGDAIWIRYGASPKASHHVLIDTGFEATANGVRKRLRDAPTIELDLFVLTHIDADHIEGGVYLLQDPHVATPGRIRDVWFNGWKHIDQAGDETLGAVQGEYFSALIDKHRLPWNAAFDAGAVVTADAGDLPQVTLAGGMKLTLLSPSLAKLQALRAYWVKDLKGKLDPGDEKAALRLLAEDAKYAPDSLGDKKIDTLVGKKFIEDTAKANGSSIAFLAEYGGKRMLFTGDAHPSVLVAALDRLNASGRPLALDVLKLSHHGSGHNTSPELLERLKARHVLVSTNGTMFRHPDAETLARVIDAWQGNDLAVHFNYATEFTKPWNEADLKKKYGYSAHYGDEGSLTVSIDD